jgi:hypothetical protein
VEGRKRVLQDDAKRSVSIVIFAARISVTRDVLIVPFPWCTQVTFRSLVTATYADGRTTIFQPEQPSHTFQKTRYEERMTSFFKELTQFVLSPTPYRSFSLAEARETFRARPDTSFETGMSSSLKDVRRLVRIQPRHL